MQQIAEALGVPWARSSAWPLFTPSSPSAPKGKHIIRFCESAPCHIRGAEEIFAALEEELGVSPGQTTADGLFTLEHTSCLGVCGVAPAMMVDEVVYGNLTRGKIREIIGEVSPRRRPPPGSEAEKGGAGMAFYRSHVLICGGTPCVLGGCRAVKEAFLAESNVSGWRKRSRVVETGCLGPCDQGPILIVYPEGTTYAKVRMEDVPVIVEEHLLKGRMVERLVYREGAGERVVTYAQSDYYGPQKRVVLRNCGVINPESIEEYIAHDGYAALGKAVTGMTPARVVEEIKASGLRGRGGAAFPTGLKWSFTAKVEADQKYIICNADEGEPGTFKDRLILEGDPHGILEGMAIAGYAVGATRGFIYIRGEYRQSIERLTNAIEQARSYGPAGRGHLRHRTSPLTWRSARAPAPIFAAMRRP